MGTSTFTYTACDRTSGGRATPRRPHHGDRGQPRARRRATTTACTSKNQPVTIDVLANDSDPDGNPLSVTVTQHPANGTAVRNSEQHA